MKYLVLVITALASVGVSAANNGNIPTINAYEVCGAYFRKEPGMDQKYEALKKFGFEMDSLCAGVKEEQEGEPDPRKLAVNMMAQFYGVPETAITATVTDRASQKATVIATAPGNHRCRFEVVRAPIGVEVPNGWLTAAPECSNGGAGGITVIDGVELEKIQKAAAAQKRN